MLVACRKAGFFAIDNDLAFAGKNTVDCTLPRGGQTEHLLPQEAYSADLRTSQGELFMKLRPILSNRHFV